MHFETSNSSTPRLPLYKLRWRAVVAAQPWPADTLPAMRRQPRAAGQRPGRCDFSRRAGQFTGADCGRRSRSPQPARTGEEICVYQEILRGAAIGVVACLVLVCLTGASHFGVVAAAIWGSCFGALIGMLLCVASAEVPEDPVLPPSPEQARGEPADKPRQRR